MDVFSRDDVRKLAEDRNGPHVSVFLPTHRTGEETRQDPIRLKNLLREAESRLLASGLRSPDARELLAPAAQLLDDILFWQRQSDGLALFLRTGASHRYRVPVRLEELVVVGQRFHLTPLFPLLTGDGRFCILAISQKSVRLLEATRYTVDEVEPEGLPKSLADTLRFDVLEKSFQFHTRAPERGGGRAAVFYGHGPGDEVAKNQLLRYFQQIDAGLRSYLGNGHVPLVLAGVDYYFPIYREANSYPHLVSEGLRGNPELLRPAELHQQAWALVEPLFKAAEEEALAKFADLAGTGRTSTDVEELVPAAHQGRVESLFVARGARQAGLFDPVSGKVQVQSAPDPQSEDLVDLATIRTYLNGGKVYVLEPARLPQGAKLAGVFRW